MHQRPSGLESSYTPKNSIHRSFSGCISSQPIGSVSTSKWEPLFLVYAYGSWKWLCTVWRRPNAAATLYPIRTDTRAQI